MTRSTAATQERVLIVRTAGVRCAVRLALVREVLEDFAVMPVPLVPRAIVGVVLVRGEPVPAVDVAQLIEAAGSGAATRMLVVRHRDQAAALLVDAVEGIATVEIRPRRSRAAGLAPRLSNGTARTAEALLPLLDVDAALASLRP